ncbi:MAG TPA: two-component regulator propeller domain-containing protein [bacterium]|nr:two-component regulator propeller domain-containing protein [bacterium]
MANTAPLPLQAVFEHVSINEGIAPDLVFCMHQDRRGFLWLGTMYGLLRFDGSTYVSFRSDPFDSTSLSNDDVVALAEDAGGNLWIATYGGGVNFYDRSAGRFVRYLPDAPPGKRVSDGTIWDIAVAPDRSVWAATMRGLDRIDPEKGTVTTVLAISDSANAALHAMPRTVAASSDGMIWLGTFGAGLMALDSSSGAIRPSPESENTLPRAKRISAVEEDREGRLWVASHDGGVWMRPHDSAAFVHIGKESGYSSDLAPAPKQCLHVDGTGLVWTGGFAGLECIDPDARTIQHWTHDPANSAGLSGPSVSAVCRDLSGVLWVSCYMRGLDRLLPGGRFATFGRDFPALNEDAPRRVLSFCEDGGGKIWIGTGRGLILRDGIAGAFRATPIEDPVRALVLDSNGTLWIGASSGLYFHPRAGNRFEAWSSGGASRTPADVTTLLLDHAGDLWAGTNQGLQRINPRSKSTQRFMHDPQDSTTLLDNAVLSLFEDSRQRIWAGTYRGISRLDANRKSFEHIRRNPRDPQSLGNNYVYALHAAKDATMWLGTGGGLEQYDESSGTFTHFRERDGLPSSVVLSILEDDAGDLWLGTQRGLSKFERGRNRFVNFEVADGLQSNLFSARSALRMTDGTLLFGGVQGYNAFQPREIIASSWAPPVVLTTLRTPGQEPPAWSDASFLESARFGPSENSFTCEFAALDSRRPGRQRYAYRLEGLDEHWIDSGTRRSASYTSVPPGHYLFRVKAAGADGVWNETGAALPLQLDPPFYRTTWFAALVLSIALASLTLAQRLHVRSRVQRALEIERALSGEREALRRRAAADFHDELGHRLARIGLFSELALRRTARAADDEVHTALARIGDEARRLAGDARDFFWSLGAERGTLGDLAARLAHFGEHLFERTEIEFRADGLREELDAIELEGEDRRNLLSIFKEAMTNALRHAQCRQVTLKVELLEESFALSLEDDGCGFRRTTTAAGHGLRNMEWRANKIDGTIRIASSPGQGTIVALTRPLARTANGSST